MIYTIVQTLMQYLILNQLNIIKQIFLNIYPALKIKILLVPVNYRYNTDPAGQATSTTVTRLPSPFDKNEFERWNVEFW